MASASRMTILTAISREGRALEDGRVALAACLLGAGPRAGLSGQRTTTTSISIRSSGPPSSIPPSPTLATGAFVMTLARTYREVHNRIVSKIARDHAGEIVA